MDPSGLVGDDSLSSVAEQVIAEGQIDEILFVLEADASSAGPGTAVQQLLKNFRAAERSLRSLLTKAPKGDCVSVANRLSDVLKSLNIAHKVVSIETRANMMYFNGRLVSEFGWHRAIVIGNYVYDKFTGPSGMTVAAYQATISAGSVDARFVGW